MKQKIFIVASILFLASCSIERGFYFKTTPRDVLLNASPHFPEARAVLINNCVSCHAQFADYNEVAFVNNDLIVKGDPAASKLFSYLKGSNVGGPETMPKLKNPLSSRDLGTLQTWIETMNTPDGPPVSPSQARWLKAQAVLQTSCISCHATKKKPHFDASSEEEMIKTELVTPGDAANSDIYQVISGTGDVRMPPNYLMGPQDVQTIQTWINQIGKP